MAVESIPLDIWRLVFDYLENSPPSRLAMIFTCKRFSKFPKFPKYYGVHRDMLAYAAYEGSADLMLWLMTIGYTVTEKEIYYAVRGGHLALVKAFVKHVWKLTTRCTAEAAAKNNLSMLAELVKMKCPMDFTATNWAAMAGHMEATRWVVEHGAPRDCSDEVLDRKHYEVFRYIYAKTGITRNAADSILSSGNILMIEWAMAKGIYYVKHRVLDIARIYEYIELEKWANERLSV